MSRRTAVSGLLVAGAIGIMNVTTYGLTLLAARLLGPDEFGQFSSVLGLLIVVNVLSLGLQATAARRISTAPDRTPRIVATISRTTLLSAVGVLALALALSPAVKALLNLTSWWSAAMMALAAAFLTIMGGLAGLLQGAERWVPLSIVYAVMGCARLGLGAVALYLDRSTAAAMTGVAVAAALPALVAWWSLRGLGTGARSAPVGAEPRSDWQPYEHRPLIREVAHSTHALLAFFALSNVDIVLTRVVLSDRDSGLYAAGLILTKAVLFLPQFVVIVAFPRMARNQDARRTHVVGLGIILALGGVACAAVWALSGWALVFTGGDAYAAVQPHLWAFALLGTLLAMVQLLVYSALAQSHGRTIRILWAGLVLLSGLGLLAADFVGLLQLTLTTDAVVLLFMLVLLVVRAGRRRVADVMPVSPPVAEDMSSPEQPQVR